VSGVSFLAAGFFFDSAEPFGPELTTEDLLAGWLGTRNQKPVAGILLTPEH